jgi:hypothetical protein
MCVMASTRTAQRATEPPATININIPLPTELHRRVKIAAASDGLTVKDAVIAALEMWVTNG